MIRTRNALAAVALSALLAACGSDDDDAPTPDAAVDSGDTMNGEADGGTGDENAAGGGDTDGDGATGGEAPDSARLDGVVRLDGGTRSASEAIAELTAAIEANENLGLVAAVDHANNAMGADLTLPPTQVALFGNPRLGTPLMLASRTAGLDLPQRLLAYEETAEGDGAGALVVLWNDPAWVAARHGIEGADETLATIAGALATLGARAAGSEAEPTPDADVAVEANAGVLTRVSENDFETTYAALRDAIAGAGPLTVVAELDHSANAASVDLELPPTRLIVFGNPALGTPLMQSARTIGLDLPQKMLVWEEGDVVTIAWNDPVWLAARHGITDQDERLETIGGALAGLAEAAAGGGEGEN